MAVSYTLYIFTHMYMCMYIYICAYKSEHFPRVWQLQHMACGLFVNALSAIENYKGPRLVHTYIYSIYSYKVISIQIRTLME